VVLKATPYHVEKAEGFGVAAVGEILAMPRLTHSDLRDIAIVATVNFTGFRMQDVERIYERNVEKLPAEPAGGAPRRFQFTLEQQKTNLTGLTLTEVEKTVMVPRICHLEMTPKETSTFLTRCQGNANFKCPTACPSAVICEYQQEKPAKAVGSKGPVIAPENLSFARALSARGDGSHRVMTAGKVGINELRAMPQRLNLLLPVELRTKKATKGHSGRHGLCSNAINAGVPAEQVALTSKHKNLMQLMGYVRPNASAMCAAGLGIGGVLASNAMLRRSVPAMREFTQEEEEEEEEVEVEMEVEVEGPDKENTPVKAVPAKAKPAAKRSAEEGGAKTPPTAKKAQRKGTPAPSSKVVRKGTPLPAKKTVHWAEDSEEEDSPDTAAQLAAATARNTNCIQHEDMRRACVRPQQRGAGSASGIKRGSYKTGEQTYMCEDGEDEEEEDGGPSGKGIHIHLHMQGGGLRKG
jgi:hypothetical protein